MKNKPEKSLRGKLNLTIHPEIREFAQHLATRRRRSISQLFEDLVEAEWMRRQAIQPSYFAPSHDSLNKSESKRRLTLIFLSSAISMALSLVSFSKMRLILTG